MLKNGIPLHHLRSWRLLKVSRSTYVVALNVKSNYFFSHIFQLDFYKKVKCSHMGKKDVIKHCNTRSHLDNAELQKTQTKVQLLSNISNRNNNTNLAELKMAMLTASSNIPLAFHHRLSSVIRRVFLDSNITTKYHSA